ncbi:MAG: hypothetical protein D6800_05670 [Candidatus Zixiibacteriota bacterium]|nr:MAG: hypothetical protein D6800_05670 [candidate division Zixibacteria bacterium]
MKDILDFALQMERDGKKFYEEQAARTSQPEVKEILLTLAAEEEKHFKFFMKMKEGAVQEAQDLLRGSKRAITATKNVFIELTEKNKNYAFGDEVREVWKKALAIEEKAEKLYRDEAAKTDDPTNKELLNRIADEEQSHVYLIDNMLSYMADPHTFGESAQFKNFRSWEGH